MLVFTGGIFARAGKGICLLPAQEIRRPAASAMQIYAIRGRVSLSSVKDLLPKMQMFWSKRFVKKNTSEIKHKVLPPTQPWSIAKSSSLPSPPQLPPPSELKEFWMGVGWGESGNGCILNYLPYSENQQPLPSLLLSLSLPPSPCKYSPFLFTPLQLRR